MTARDRGLVAPSQDRGGITIAVTELSVGNVVIGFIIVECHVAVAACIHAANGKYHVNIDIRGIVVPAM